MCFIVIHWLSSAIRCTQTIKHQWVLIYNCTCVWYSVRLLFYASPTVNKQNYPLSESVCSCKRRTMSLGVGWGRLMFSQVKDLFLCNYTRKKFSNKIQIQFCYFQSTKNLNICMEWGLLIIQANSGKNYFIRPQKQQSAHMFLQIRVTQIAHHNCRWTCLTFWELHSAIIHEKFK